MGDQAVGHLEVDARAVDASAITVLSLIMGDGAGGHGEVAVALFDAAGVALGAA